MAAWSQKYANGVEVGALRDNKVKETILYRCSPFTAHFMRHGYMDCRRIS